MKFLRVAEVARKAGIGVSTVWKWSKDGHRFPKPMLLTNKIAVWDEADVDAWMLQKKEESYGNTGQAEAEVVAG